MTQPRRPRAIGGALVLAVATALVVGAPAAAGAPQFDNVEVIEASSFVEAGTAVSQIAFPDGAEAAVVATSANFPDALAASALAASVQGPILYTAPEALDPATQAELARILEDGDTVHLMGGEAALSAAVADALEADGYDVRRVEGPTRLETAVAAGQVVGVPEDGTVIVARAFGPDGANTPSDRTTGWVDAISCGAYAAAAHAPIYLTETDVLSPPTRDALVAAQPSRAVVCGGDVAVSEAVAVEITDLGIPVQRIAGVTRVETAVEAAKQLFGFESAAGHDYLVVPGYGPSFGYGLAATPLAAQRIAPILLVGQDEPTACDDTSQPSRETLCYLATAADDPAFLTIVGDETVIGPEVLEAAARAAGGEVGTPPPPPPPPPPGPLDPPSGVELVDDTNDGGTQMEVRWEPVEGAAGYNVYLGEGDDAERVGDGVTTVPGDAERYVLQGLEAGREVTVAVTTVASDQSESERSDAVTGTPTDEVPPAVDGFTARAGDDDARLSWTPSTAPDVDRYVLHRREVEAGEETCPTTGYADLTTLHGRDLSSYTDSSAENGTTYCYSIAAQDAGGQVSPRTRFEEPVTPEIGIPTVAVVRPLGDNPSTPANEGETVHFGAPYDIRYEITDRNDDLSTLRVTIELSLDGGSSYTDLAVNAEPTPDPADTTDDDTYGALYSWTPPDPGSAGEPDARIRISASDGFRDGPRDATGNFTITRSPRTVRGLAAAGEASRVVLSWERNPETTVTGYEVLRASRTIVGGQGDRDDICSTVTSDQYTKIADVPQTDEGEDPGYTDAAVDPGNASVDTRYCYRVRAVAMVFGEVRNGGFATASANPGGETADVELQRPDDGEIIRRGNEYTIRYQVTIPAGATANRVGLSYCRDYEAEPTNPFEDPDCNVEWVTITSSAPAAEGDNTYAWVVPRDETTAQGDGVTGAVRAQVFATDDGSASPQDTSISHGIQFT